MPKNFVIFYMAREGSSPIIEQLGRHPDLSVPIFEHLDSYLSGTICNSDSIARLASLVMQHGDYNYAKTNYLDNSNDSRQIKKKGVGFKWRVWGEPRAVSKAIKENDAVVFHLFRGNFINLIVSMYFTNHVIPEIEAKNNVDLGGGGHLQFKFAEMTAEERRKIKSDLDQIKFEIQENVFLDMARRVLEAKTTVYEAYIKELQKLNVPVYSILYEDFTDRRSDFFSSICDVIGVDPNGIPNDDSMFFRRVNAISLLDQVTNWNEIANLAEFSRIRNSYENLLSKSHHYLDPSRSTTAESASLRSSMLHCGKSYGTLNLNDLPPVMDSKMIELVLPLKPLNDERGSDLVRAKEGLFATLSAFCDPKFVRRLSVIVPESSLNDVRNAVDLKIPVDVICENDILNLNRSVDIPRSGWYIQQLLKMNYANHCESDYYLTLDADIFLMRKLASEIVIDGRFPAKYEPASAHWGWWETSANLLRSAHPIQNDDKQAFGVTPSFINKNIMRQTIARLNDVALRLGHPDWASYLISNANNSDQTWTEYSLYWTYLRSNVRADDFYYESNLYNFFHYIEEFDSKGLHLNDESSPLFTVMQSSKVTDSTHAAFSARLLSDAGLGMSNLENTDSRPAADGCFLEPNLQNYGRKVYSQNDEDGIIEKIMDDLQIVDGTFVEFGVGPSFNDKSGAQGLEANCRLLHERGWKGLWMDGSPSDISVQKEYITALNINSLLKKYNFNFDVDVFSIDVDGQDFWIWMNLEIRPKLMIVEYNCDFDPDESKVVPFDVNFRWDCTNYMGASLKALCKLAASKSYTPVYANGVNVFFVRDDLISNRNDFAKISNRPRQPGHRKDPLNRDWVVV